MIEALEGSVHGKVVNLDELTVACARIYPSIMRQTKTDGRPVTAADVIRRTLHQTLANHRYGNIFCCRSFDCLCIRYFAVIKGWRQRFCSLTITSLRAILFMDHSRRN